MRIFSIIKVTTTILAFLITLSVNICIGQQPDEIKVTVNYKNESLKKVIDNLSELADIDFSYSPQQIDLSIQVTYSATDKTLKEVLDEILADYPIRYEVIENQVILKKDDTKVQVEKNNLIKKITLSGKIIEAKTGEFLIGATVYIIELELGTICNTYGFYSLSVPPGKYTVQVSFVGYEVQKSTIELSENKILNFRMEPLSNQMEEVVVTAYDLVNTVFDSRAAQSNMTAMEAKRQTSVMGESDILKSLETLPGITYLAEGSSYFNVRGGQYDQNLILIDEAAVYIPSHLLGLFSTVIPDAIKNTEVYKADFPIKYGGRISSVIDIHTKDGNKNRFSGSGSLGLLAGRMSVEGPIKRERSSYFISGRRSYFGSLIKSLNPNLEKLHFYDFTSKFNTDIGNKDRLFLTIYSGRDIFLLNKEDTRTGISWGNNTLTLRWNHIYGPKLFSNTTWYVSKYEYYFYEDQLQDLYWQSLISNSSLKSEYTYYQNPKRTIQFGINLGGYLFNPGNYSGENIDLAHSVSKNSSTEIYLYTGVEEKLNNKLKMNYGIRITSWLNYGENDETFVINYDSDYNPTGLEQISDKQKYYSNVLIEPRLSLSYKVLNNLITKISYNRTIQNVNMLSNSISPFNSLEVWLPSGPNIKPQKADILDFGIIALFRPDFLELNFDVYYKRMYNQIGYANHTYMMLNPLIEGEIRQGDGKSYGIEMRLKKTSGKLTGWLNYTWSRSLLQIDGVNNNQEFPASYDRPHNFQMGIDLRLKSRWFLTGVYVITSGTRLSTPTSYYLYRGKQVPVYTNRNNDKLPNYQRFDLSTTINLNKPDRKYQHELTIAFYNFFYNKSAAMLYFNKTYVESDNHMYVPSDVINPAVITPSYRYIFSIVPSLTYSFSF